MRLKDKNKFLENLSTKLYKILNSDYSSKDAVLKERFKEVNKVLGKENQIKEDYFYQLYEKGIEPVRHIINNCFLVFYFNTHTFGVVDFKTKEIILPLKYSDIDVNESSIDNNGIIVTTETVDGETNTFLINEKAKMLHTNSKIKSTIAKDIALKHNFIDKIIDCTDEKANKKLIG